ncbi:MAG: response regulator transcription factor [Cytophagaceae bacterium]|nr:response regulator transcription factor [Gemmatimonadaceae bacterium]
MITLPPTVFIVDPNAAGRHALGATIRRAGLRAESFASAGEFLARPRSGAPSCLLLELAPRAIDAFALQHRVSIERKETPVIVMSSEVDVASLVQAMKAGAVEVFMKPVADDVLLQAVGEALARSRAVLQQEDDIQALRQRYDALSVREREVMGRVVAGLLNKQVGAALGISVVTVKAHRGRVMRKMGAESLAGLVAMALRLDLRLAVSPRASTSVSRVPLADLARRQVSNSFSSAAR